MPEIFCDDRFPRIRTQPGYGEAEQYRQVDFFDPWFDRVAKTDIDDNRNPRAGQPRRRTQAEAAIFKLLPYQINPQRIDVK